jgi:uncharacterized protein
LTQLEKAVARGELKRPVRWDPMLDALVERGKKHERDYVQHLIDQGSQVITIPGVDVDDAAIDATLAAMAAGTEVIAQGALRSGRWAGRADILRRVDKPSALGGWSYEALDTKLSRTTKAGTILQLSLYSEMLADMQGVSPALMHVVQPWTDFQPEQYRVADFAAFHRRVKASLERALDGGDQGTYPEPVAHCDICSWRPACKAKRIEDDHLCLVAGLTKLNEAELKSQGINTLTELAGMPLPLTWRPERGSTGSYERLADQARLQLEARATEGIPFAMLPPQPGCGLALLPKPNDGDIFLDFEGDPFVGSAGLEYLLGYHFYDGAEWHYEPLWAFTPPQEKAAFERFIDFVVGRLDTHPGLHIYHYGAYERSALTRLMGRYATREEELDQLLRSKRLIDMLTVVRQGLRAGVESYSIKKLEPLYGFVRDADLPDANLALAKLQVSLELGELDDISDEDRAVVAVYNQDDCASTRGLRDWLEQRRAELVADGHVIERPAPGEEEAQESVTEWLALIGPLVEQLTQGVDPDPEQRSAENHAKWLLANLLDFHRREDKATWWEIFRLRDLPAEDLFDEKAALSDLTYVGTIDGGTPACPIHRYNFPLQDTDIRAEKGLERAGGDGRSYGKVVAIDYGARTIDIKKTKATADIHATGVFIADYITKEVLKQSLVRLAQHVIANGMTGAGPYVAARDLLLRSLPQLPQPLRHEGEPTLNAAKRLATTLNNGVLPFQGPPGTGKTYTGAHMIIGLAQAGKKVGVAANSHKVIRTFLNSVLKVAGELGADICCVQKPDEVEPDLPRLKFAKNSQGVFTALNSGCQVAGATAWFWAAENAFQCVDVLFVDEAAQMALASVLAASQAAPALVLLGDPQQLDQPMQGSHPDGTGCSALHHLLDGQQTIRAEQGLFLDTTWRLHPDICAFTSELFYEGKLDPLPGLEQQCVAGQAPVEGHGLRFVPVEHHGNTNCSPEEAQAVADLVNQILEVGATWTDRHGVTKPIALKDVLIITPYNAQVIEIQRRLPGAEVGTVDKFQGKEAPVAIYSLATSSPADAPRGMDFLYSSNRLNVATSRGQCLSIVVANPALFAADAKSPGQMKLANAFCRFSELAVTAA